MEKKQPTARRILIGAIQAGFMFGVNWAFAVWVLSTVSFAMAIMGGLIGFGMWVNWLTSYMVPNLCADLVLRERKENVEDK